MYFLGIFIYFLSFLYSNFVFIITTILILFLPIIYITYWQEEIRFVVEHSLFYLPSLLTLLHLPLNQYYRIDILSSYCLYHFNKRIRFLTRTLNLSFYLFSLIFLSIISVVLIFLIPIVDIILTSRYIFHENNLSIFFRCLLFIFLSIFLSIFSIITIVIISFFPIIYITLTKEYTFDDENSSIFFLLFYFLPLLIIITVLISLIPIV